MRPSTSAAISGVSGAPARNTSCTSGGSSFAARNRYGRPFCRVIRPTNVTLGACRVDAEAGDDVGFPVGCVLFGVDAVVHHLDPVRIDRRVGGEHVALHAVRHGDDRVGGLQRGALDPRRQRVAATELFGLPRPERFETVRGDDVRHAVQQLRDVPGEVGVPGVGVHQVGAGAAGDHLQVDAHRAQGRVGLREAGRVGVGDDARLVAGRTEAVHPHVGQRAQASRRGTPRGHRRRRRPPAGTRGSSGRRACPDSTGPAALVSRDSKARPLTTGEASGRVDMNIPVPPVTGCPRLRVRPARRGSQRVRPQVAPSRWCHRVRRG